MSDNATVVDTTVVDNSVVNPSLDTIKAQQVTFKAQYEQVKKDMAKLQQDFETLKLKGVRLEGAIEAGEILLKSLQK